MHPLTWIGAGLAGAEGLVNLGLLLYIFVSRATFPLDLEWMEGGMLCHALRIMEGQPLYAPPSADFISFLYPPLYPFLLAALGKLVGLSYTLGRVISAVCILSAMALVFVAVRRETGGKQGYLWGLAAVGLIATSFQHSGSWFDLVRNDSLMIATVTGCLYLVRYHHRSWPALVCAGLLASIAFLTKQTAIFFILASGLALLVLNRRRLPVYCAIVTSLSGGALLVLNHHSDGWFWTYIFKIHQEHHTFWSKIWPGTEIELLSLFPVVGGIFILWTAVLAGRWIGRRSLPSSDNGPLYWYLMAFVGVLCSAVGHATAWAYTNAFIPGFFFLSTFAPMASVDLLRRVEARFRRPLHVGIAGLALGMAVTAQMRFQALDPEKFIPTVQNEKNALALIAHLRKLDGPMLMPYHPYYPVLAGKRPGFHNMSLKDVAAAGMAMPADLSRRLRGHYYRAIILDHEPTVDHSYILPSYKLGSALASHEMPRVLTGYDSYPQFVYLPKVPDPVPDGARRVFGFEDGTYGEWTVKGRAFGSAPAGGSLKDQNPVGPFEGAYLANSFHGGDATTGTMMSPQFLVDRSWLSYRIGGGRDPKRLFLRLLVEGQEVHRATGANTEAPAVRRVNVRAYIGKKMRVELVDSSGAGWGHLLFDDLMLLGK